MMYIVKCKKCKAERKISIVGSEGKELIDWLDNNPSADKVKIISGRKRFDGQWGWCCICGNDDIMTEQEKNYIDNPQEPADSDILKIVNNLKGQKPLFEMRSI